MNFLRRAEILSILGLVGVIALGWLVNATFRPRVLARASVPGVEMAVVQEKGEPYNSAFYFRKSGQNWGWFYIDHEAWYWRTAKIRVDEAAGCATVTHAGDKVAVFSWKDEAFTLFRLNRTVSGAQFRMPKGWEPGMRSDHL